MKIKDKQTMIIRKDHLYTITKTVKDGEIEISIQRIDNENIEDEIIKLFVEIQNDRGSDKNVRTIEWN